MMPLLQQCQSMFAAAIDREISRLHQPSEATAVDSVPSDSDMTSLRPATATPSQDVQPVANAGDGNFTSGSARLNCEVAGKSQRDRQMEESPLSNE